MLRVANSTLGTVESVRQTLAFRLIDTRHRGGLRLRRHAHERAGVTFVLDGGYREEVVGGELTCRRGSIVFKPAGSGHGNIYGPRGAHALHLEIADTSWMNESLRLPDRDTELGGARAAYIAAQLAREFRLDDTASRLALDALGMELLSVIVRGGDGPTDAATAPGWIQKAVQLLHETTDEPLSLREIAIAVNMPPRMVARGFRRWVGTSVGEYARRLRIDGAAKMLRTSDRPIATIAIDAGFCDQSHLTRCFKEILGVTPAAYRRLCRQ